MEKNEVIKVEKKGLKTAGDRYIDTLSKEAEIVMNGIRRHDLPGVKGKGT